MRRERAINQQARVGPPFTPRLCPNMVTGGLARQMTPTAGAAWVPAGAHYAHHPLDASALPDVPGPTFESYWAPWVFPSHCAHYGARRRRPEHIAS